MRLSPPARVPLIVSSRGIPHTRHGAIHALGEICHESSWGFLSRPAGSFRMAKKHWNGGHSERSVAERRISFFVDDGTGPVENEILHPSGAQDDKTNQPAHDPVEAPRRLSHPSIRKDPAKCFVGPFVPRRRDRSPRQQLAGQANRPYESLETTIRFSIMGIPQSPCWLLRNSKEEVWGYETSFP